MFAPFVVRERRSTVGRVGRLATRRSSRGDVKSVDARGGLSCGFQGVTILRFGKLTINTVSQDTGVGCRTIGAKRGEGYTPSVPPQPSWPRVAAQTPCGRVSWCEYERPDSKHTMDRHAAVSIITARWRYDTPEYMTETTGMTLTQGIGINRLVTAPYDT